MQFSRREALITGGALAAIPLIRALPAFHSAETIFPTGWKEIDHELNGGMRPGTLLVVIGPRGSGKTDFLVHLAKTNGIVDGHAINRGSSDMLSIMQRGDGQYIGSIMMNGVEPSTDKERADMDRDPQARDAFLTRWFARTKAVLADSGGIFALTVNETFTPGATPNWMSLPDYLIEAQNSTYRVLKSGPQAAKNVEMKP